MLFIPVIPLLPANHLPNPTLCSNPSHSSHLPILLPCNLYNLASLSLLPNCCYCWWLTFYPFCCHSQSYLLINLLLFHPLCFTFILSTFYSYTCCYFYRYCSYLMPNLILCPFWCPVSLERDQTDAHLWFTLMPRSSKKKQTIAHNQYSMMPSTIAMYSNTFCLAPLCPLVMPSYGLV